MANVVRLGSVCLTAYMWYVFVIIIYNIKKNACYISTFGTGKTICNVFFKARNMNAHNLLWRARQNEVVGHIWAPDGGFDNKSDLNA